MTLAGVRHYACRGEEFPPGPHTVRSLPYRASANRWIAPVVGLPELPYDEQSALDDDFAALAGFAAAVQA